MFDPEGLDLSSQNTRREIERAEAKKRACEQCLKHCRCTACCQVWCGDCSCFSSCKTSGDSNCCSSCDASGVCGVLSKVFNRACFQVCLQILSVLGVLVNAAVAVVSVLNKIDMYKITIIELICNFAEVSLLVFFSVILIVGYIKWSIIQVRFPFISSWISASMFNAFICCWAFAIAENIRHLTNGGYFLTYFYDSFTHAILLATISISFIGFVYGFVPAATHNTLDSALDEDITLDENINNMHTSVNVEEVEAVVTAPANAEPEVDVDSD